MIGKIRRRLSEFLGAPDKVYWLREQWKWRRFAREHKKQLALNLIFDREHGVETAAEILLEQVGIPPAEVSRGNGIYRPLTEQLFREMFASIVIDAREFTFVDIGSGKGKVLFMAADLPFRRIVGVEYAIGLHEVALRNVADFHSAKQQCRAVEVVHGDALKYPLPPGPVVLHVFNALAPEVMRELLIKLDAAAAHSEQPIILIYTNLRSVKEAGDVFDGLRNLPVIRRQRHFVAIANAAGKARVTLA
jgi:SAM-dependent methyltransferase